MEKTLKLNSNEEAVALYGSLDENLRYVEKEYHVRISARNHRLRIAGEKGDVEKAYRFFLTRLEELRQGPRLSRKNKNEYRENTNEPGGEAGSGTPEEAGSAQGSVHFFHRGKIIRPRSKNQEKYLEAIRDRDIVVGVGPAGTGKTYLAMAAAVDHLKKKLVSKIILTRPAVEAGESLGFLPGDLYAKVNPYLRPLYDALYDMMEYEDVARALERGIIEVAPLAYMRGRTLNDSFVVLDEAQNCTHMQMKMFLTRLGENSRMVVNGDLSQVDLPRGVISGLKDALDTLENVSSISSVTFSANDVVRHGLVAKIVKAYEEKGKKQHGYD